MSTVSFGKRSSTPGAVHVVAFGKHPAWDDHIEEIGLATDGLVRLKRQLYNDGITGNIDSGTWDKLDDDKRLAEFAHSFYWRTADGWLIGRMWSSVDGKGRRKYPMVIGVMPVGLGFEASIAASEAPLAAMEEACKTATDREGVRKAAEQCSAQVRAAIDGLSTDGASRVGGESQDLIKELASAPVFADGDSSRAGLYRILYEMDREFGAYRAMTGKTRSTASVSFNAAHIRVPKVTYRPLHAWTGMLRDELVPNAPLLLIDARDQGFIDVVVGEPSTASLFCLRASRVGLPLTSSVPYTLSVQFVSQADAKIDAWLSGKKAEPVPSKPATKVASAPTLRPSAPVSGGSAMLLQTKLMIGVGSAAVLLAIVILVITMGGPPKAPAGEDATSGTKKPTGGDAPSSTAANTANGDESKQSLTVEKKATEQQPTEVAKVTPLPPAPVPAPATKPQETQAEVTSQSNTPAATTDARAGSRGDDQLASLRTQIAALTAAAQAEHDVSSIKPQLNINELEAQVASLASELKAAKRIAPTAANQAAIARAMTEFDNGVARLRANISGLEAGSKERLAGYITKLSLNAPADAPEAAQAWKNAILEVKSDSGWAAAGKEIGKARARLQDGATALNAMPAWQPSIAVPAGINIEVLRSRAKSARESAVAAALASTPDPQAAENYITSLGAIDAGIASAANVTELLASDSYAQAVEKFSSLTSQPGYDDVAYTGLQENISYLTQVLEESSPAGLTSLLEKAPKGEDVVSRACVRAGFAQAQKLTWDAASVASLQSYITSSASTRGDTENASAKGIFESIYIKLYNSAAASSNTAELMRLADIAGRTDAQQNIIEYNKALANLKQPGDNTVERAGVFVASHAATEDSPAQAKVIAAAHRAATAPKKADVSDVLALGPFLAAWSAQEGANGTVSYSTAASDRVGAKQITVTFIPLPPSSSGEITYVATAEMSVLATARIISVAQRWGDVSKLPFQASGGERPAGVGAWRWVPRESARAFSAVSGDVTQWLPIGVNQSVNGYVSTNIPAQSAPGPDSPMTYISPKTALLVARLVGCRLPTVNEFAAAMNLQSASGLAPNRRDVTFMKQAAHALTVKLPGSVAPDAGKFVPEESSETADVAVSEDDGLVWFRSVNGASPEFESLEGNVAEYVWDGEPSDLALDKLNVARKAIAEFVEKEDKVRIMGASAFSGANVSPKQPYRFQMTAANSAWSDVGYRLAFTAPPKPPVNPNENAELAQAVQKAIEEAKFIAMP